ncbi:DUF4129 domain-containing protein [Nocardioides sp.]|uniref:DUF4129 domain-containing protein n=1 Tax=Nocardioides sp. TaxID=35761 RepID=UPI0031FF36F0|nr:integral rane protein [Nocardioides sp.]
MTPLLLRDPPVQPSPDEARSWLRRELLHPEYHQQNVLQQVLTWLQQQVRGGLNAAQDAPPLSTFAAMVVLVLLVLGLGWLLSRARWSARARDEQRVVLTDEVVTSAELRRRAETALAEGRHEDALVDGFRALAVRQVERGRLDDAPGATAHEVATSLAGTYPHQRPRVAGSAVLFEAVLYGDHSATRDQAVSVLDLDNELAGLR